MKLLVTGLSALLLSLGVVTFSFSAFADDDQAVTEEPAAPPTDGTDADADEAGPDQAAPSEEAAPKEEKKKKSKAKCVPSGSRLNRC